MWMPYVWLFSHEFLNHWFNTKSNIDGWNVFSREEPQGNSFANLRISFFLIDPSRIGVTFDNLIEFLFSDRLEVCAVAKLNT
jgi:hypothetical protein